MATGRIYRLNLVREADEFTASKEALGLCRWGAVVSLEVEARARRKLRRRRPPPSRSQAHVWQCWDNPGGHRDIPSVVLRARQAL